MSAVLDPAEWTLTTMTYVALGLFLIAIVAAIRGRNVAEELVGPRWIPSTWFVAAALVSAIQLIVFNLVSPAGSTGDWTDSAASFGLWGAYFYGPIALIATTKAAGDIPRWQWLT